MQPFSQVESHAVVLRRANVDTDQIIPMRFLITAERSGLGRGLFADWRRLPGGAEDPAFALNRPECAGATILLAGANFGCGSSREHAPWALADHGIRAIVAESYGGIFRDNCMKNGLLPVTLPAEAMRTLMDRVEGTRAKLRVDLVACRISGPDGFEHDFDIEPGRREALLAGLDEIGLTLAREADIAAYQAADRQRRPWIYR